MRIVRLLVVVGCLCCGAACNGPLTPEAEKLLESGRLAYKQGDDNGAVRKMDLFLKDWAKSRQADEAYYYRGLAKYRTHNLPGAREDLQAALDRTRRKAVRVGAMVALGDLADDTDDTAAAEKVYLDVLKDIDRDKKPADHVCYRLGCTLQRQGRWKDADAYFDKVIYLFNGTELAGRAQQHVRCKAWTIQAGAFEAKPRADAAAAALRREGLDASSQPALRDGKPVFLVNVGRYPTFRQAAADLSKVRRHCNDAFVTTTR